MTRDQQIRKALELLAPPPGERAECQDDISLAIDRVEHRAAAARSFRVAGSKKGKAGVRRYCAALRRLRSCLPFSRSGDQALVQPRRNSIRRREADRLSTARSQGPSLFLTAVTASAASCEPQQGRSGGGIRPAPVVGSQGRRHARREVGADLAKILAGERTVDPFDHLREFKRSPGPTVEKLRGAKSIVYRTRRR